MRAATRRVEHIPAVMRTMARIQAKLELESARDAEQPAESDIDPQPGPQQKFENTPADIAIYGGSAGSGKTFGLLLAARKHVSVSGYRCVILRRTYPRIRNQGGLWDQSEELFWLLGGQSRETYLDWTFPSGAVIKFGHMEQEKDRFDYHGAQIGFIGFDELTEFEESQFWYMLSRNRSLCGVKPCIRATCNPDADSWVADLIQWWIDQETGYPIQERSGVLRWFVRSDEKLYWADSPEELQQKIPGSIPKSLTFIPAKLEDNPILEAADPGYRANLMAMTYVDRERLLGGNWKVRPNAGLVFPRDKWKMCTAAPADMRIVRAWDKAGTEGGAGARTAGVKIGCTGDGKNQKFYILNGIAGRWNDIDRENTIGNTARMDGTTVDIWIEREGGSGGKESAHATIRNLAGYNIRSDYPTGDKYSRWKPFAAQVQAGNVWIVTEGWDWEQYVEELDRLSGDKKRDANLLKDYADASALGFNKLVLGSNGFLNRELLIDYTEYETPEYPSPIEDLRHKLAATDEQDGWGL